MSKTKELELTNLCENLGVWCLPEWVDNSFTQDDKLYIKITVPEDRLDINNELLYNYNGEYMIFELGNLGEIYDSIPADKIIEGRVS